MTELSVQGMTCSGCVRTVTRVLEAVPGVAEATVDLSNGRAAVRWTRATMPQPERLKKAVADAGYAAVEIKGAPRPASRWSPFAGWEFNVVFGSIVTGVLMFSEWVIGLGDARWYGWFGFLIALPLQIFGGARFYRGAWNQLKIGASNMDTLVALGSTTAFGFSTWVVFAGWHSHTFFMESASIITLVSIGHWLETKASARAEASLRALMNLAPQTARRLSKGHEEEVAVAALRTGDQIVLKPGDRVPVDGEVIDGSSAVDESMLTGESLPVQKSVDAKVFTGTINSNGQLIVRVSGTGEATALAQIIAVVRRAQNSRANIQQLGDRISSVFVPIVVCVAMATGLWWGLAPQKAAAFASLFPHWLPSLHGLDPLASAIYHSAAVLIIACPCAMGLATPIAVMAGTNAAARRGILIRDGMALEKTGRLTTIVFDKTGTLTEGKVSVAAFETFNLSERSAKLWASALAKRSQHPLSRAIAAMTNEVPPLENWNEMLGKGVQAESVIEESKELCRLGSLKWLAESGIDIADGDKFRDQWTSEGATVIGFSIGRKLAALFALRDQVKKGSRAIVEKLRHQGKGVCMITGDNRATALAIARELNIGERDVFADVAPAEKAGIISRLQKEGRNVAFAGDGINDAPALEQADLGIAMSSASDVAREASDIILLKSDIDSIPEALGLAEATLRTIKQNLFWAFFYNAVGIPLAAAGFFSPILCAFAMGFSDLIVIGNALRLRHWKQL